LHFFTAFAAYSTYSTHRPSVPGFRPPRLTENSRESPPDHQHPLPKNRVDRNPVSCPKTESSQGPAAHFVEPIEEQD
uniref:Uncharacterized protein n=1 Tax=Romanomermis culicivorax TaxID=13658 RepID=A0A915KQQ3_ROMCU